MPTSLLRLLGATPLWHPQTNACHDPSGVLSDRFVILYFSASWCMPCVRFTPKLIQIYQNLNKTNKNVEVLFCSMDTEKSCFESYARKMPFYTIPFQHTAVIQKLVHHYDAGSGIPHLIVLESDGRTVIPVDDAIEQVSKDPLGNKFPWRPPALSDVLGMVTYCRYNANTDSLIEHPMSDLSDKYLMLYFAAAWCPRCQEYSPKMDDIYREIQKFRTNDNDFELLLVSADRFEDEFFQHISNLSFGAISFSQKDCRKTLFRRFGIRGGPAIVMLSPNDRLALNGKVSPSQLLRPDFLRQFPFHPKKYGDLKEYPTEMNDNRCLLVFCEQADDDLQRRVMEACRTASHELAADCTVLWTTEPNAVSEAIRQATLLRHETDVQMVLMDLPNQGSYYVASSLSDDFSSADILNFVRNPGQQSRLV